MVIGEFIKEQRLNKGFSIRKLAELSGVSHPYLSQIETGKNTKPSNDVLHKLADPLGVSHFDLMVAAGYYTKEELLIRQQQEEFFNSMTSEQFDDYIEKQNEVFLIEEYRKKEFTDIEELLNGNVYFDKYKLTSKEKIMVYKILNALFEDKQKNYPSDEEIKAAYLNERNAFKNINEWKDSDGIDINYDDDFKEN
ncbi:helix-turn-helix transcriptional regulator [Sporosarcina sp. Sa2YVA2]|uniref:Helix-turn-helix transcriptional regulator n=1 Tax=Sporosarcina quadrami TaxID=2762234 RepID=A0ABR8UBA8_9BACL|nr:helix-turn-helix transcriptional regulator [Sporosarcina quadrami]MBD7985311.1 helix-turn-helix transcriptional regulator [Sporosarcina quadrami]